MTLSDSSVIVSTFVATAGAAFAGWQMLLLNRQARYERRVAYDGVAVSWQPVEAPYRADAHGSAEWTYDITVTNPGRLPIDRVEVRWVLPHPFRRLHDKNVSDEPATELLLHTPVLAGGCSRRWTRRVEMSYGDCDRLTETFAEVRYTDIDGFDHTNRSPRRARADTRRRTRTVTG